MPFGIDQFYLKVSVFNCLKLQEKQIKKGFKILYGSAEHYSIRHSKINLSPLSFPEENSDRSFIKSQVFPEGINKISVIGEMDCLGVVNENDKGWRPTCYLGGVKELDPPAPVQRGGMGSSSILENTVYSACGKCLAEFFVNSFYCR